MTVNADRASLTSRRQGHTRKAPSTTHTKEIEATADSDDKRAKQPRRVPQSRMLSYALLAGGLTGLVKRPHTITASHATGTSEIQKLETIAHFPFHGTPHSEWICP